MFTPREIRGPRIPAVRREIPAPTPQDQEQHLEPPLDEWTSINPQLTVIPGTFGSWFPNPQEEDTTISDAPRWAPVVEIPASVKIPGEAKTLTQSKTLSSFSIKRLRTNAKSTGNSSQRLRSPDKSLDAIGGDSRPAIGPFHSVGVPMGPSPYPLGLDLANQPFGQIPNNHEDSSQFSAPLESSGVTYLGERTDNLPQNFGFKWKDPWEDSAAATNHDQNHPDWNPDPTVCESASSPGFSIVVDSPVRVPEPGDTNMVGQNQGSGSQWPSRWVVSPSSSISHEGDDEGGGWELDYDFDLKATKKIVKDALKKLRVGKQEMNPEDELAFREQQDEIKIGVIQALLKWIPSIHLVALGIEDTGSPENAHQCLVYAAKSINTLDTLGNNYDLEDLKYGVSVQLGKNKTIKEWRNVAGYQPYGILVWIWRDLCLSILLNEDLDEDPGAELISRLFSDIKNCVPSENYDFREKRHILSFWDLFLTGGLLANRKGTPRKIADPAYWSGSFIKAKMRLDQLYCADRLSELRAHPSVDLYSTVKNIFPEKYKKEPLEAVKNGCSPSTVDGQIDIFAFEHDTTSLERLIENNLLERSSKRYRDVLLSFSYLSPKKPEVEWARKQVLIGFEEVVDVFLEELVRVFPGVHNAFSALDKGEGIEGDKKEWFLLKAREGYTEGHGHGVPPIMGVVDGPGNSHGAVEECSKMKMNFSYIFGAYLGVGTRWSGGSGGPSRERLLRDMKTIFLSRVGIIFELDRWIGQTLKKGNFDARELGLGLDFLLGDFGFEKILNAGVKTKKPGTSNRARPAVKVPKKKRAVKNVSRGMAIAKAKGNI